MEDDSDDLLAQIDAQPLNNITPTPPHAWAPTASPTQTVRSQPASLSPRLADTPPPYPPMGGSPSPSYPPDPSMPPGSPLPPTNTERLEQIIWGIDRDHPLSVAEVRALHDQLLDLLASLRE